MASIPRLLLVLGKSRSQLALEGNNFDWSCWDDSADALAEVDAIRQGLSNGDFVPEGKMDFLFLPTGPLQEVSMSSGWSDEYCELADEFESARAETACLCVNSPKNQSFPFETVGSTKDYAEITKGRCPSCGQYWLRYFYENEAFTASGRWYLGAVENADVAPNDAKEILENLPWYWYGGSYFTIQNGISSGTIY